VQSATSERTTGSIAAETLDVRLSQSAEGKIMPEETRTPGEQSRAERFGHARTLPLAPGRLRGDHLRMSDPGFMGAPPPIKSADELVAAPAPDADGPDWWWKIPNSAMDTKTFTGCEADLFFAAKEPTTAQVMKIAGTGTPMATFPDYVREIGVPDEHGKVRRDPNTPDPRGHEGGAPIMQRVDHIRAAQWFARIGTKGQACAITVWVELFTVTNDEGESMRGSRRRAG